MQLPNNMFSVKFVNDVMTGFMSADESEQNDAVTKAHTSLSGQEVSLIDLISSMEKYLTSSEERIRSKSTLFLSKILSCSPPLPLPAYQLHHLLVFFMHRLSDHPSTPASLIALNSLVTSYHSVLDAKYGDINDMLQHVFALDSPSQPQSIRYKTYELHISILTLLPAHIPSSTARSDYFSSMLDSIEGEKDPRCLLLTLRIASLLAPLIQEVNKTHLTQRMFEGVICYFPITFSPPPNDPYQITSEMLQIALTGTLTSSKDIASLSIPFLLNTLHDTNSSASTTQALTVLMEAVRLYTYLPFAPHLVQCSELLLESAAAGDAPEALYDVITLLSRSISVHNDAEGTTSFINYFIMYCSRKLQSAATLVSAAMKHISHVLLALCRATLPLAYGVFTVIFPLLLKHMKESLVSAPSSSCGTSSADNSEITLVSIALTTQLLQCIPAHTTFTATDTSNPLLHHGKTLCAMLTAVLYQRPLVMVETQDEDGLENDEKSASGCCGGGCGSHGQTNQTTSVVKPHHLQSASGKCLQELLLRYLVRQIRLIDIIRYTPLDVDMHVLLDPMSSYLLSTPSSDVRNSCCVLLASLMDVSTMFPYIANVVEGVVSSTGAPSVAAAASLLNSISSADSHNDIIDRLASHVIATAATDPDSATLASLKDILMNSSRVAKILVESNQFVVFAQYLMSNRDARVSTIVCDIIEMTVKNSTSLSELTHFYNEVVSLAKQDLTCSESLQLLHSGFRYCLPKTRSIDECANDASLIASCCQHSDSMGVRVVALLLNKCSQPTPLLERLLALMESQPLDRFVYIVKAYCMRPDTRVADMLSLLERIISRLPAVSTADTAAHPIALLLENDSTLSPNSTANVTPLYAAKMWNQLQKLLEPELAGTATTISHPILLAYISLVGVPVVSPSDVESALRRIIMGLTIATSPLERDLKASAVIALKKYISEYSSLLGPHLGAIVPQLLSISQTHAPRARAASLECIFTISQTTPYITLHPMKTVVVKGLVKTLDDPKAAVRLLAAKARNAWISLK